ncbi:MAG TPA: hypothetical protein VGC01_11220 [Mucilaginibacter sp.]
MKNYALILVHVATAFVLLAVACSDPIKSKLQGKWTSKDGKTKLQITDKHLTMDNDAVVPEDYFVKGDTIYTSFQGNRPYTKFVVHKLENNNLTLIGPDSISTEYSR